MSLPSVCSIFAPAAISLWQVSRLPSSAAGGEHGFMPPSTSGRSPRSAHHQRLMPLYLRTSESPLLSGQHEWRRGSDGVVLIERGPRKVLRAVRRSQDDFERCDHQWRTSGFRFYITAQRAPCLPCVSTCSLPCVAWRVMIPILGGIDCVLIGAAGPSRPPGLTTVAMSSASSNGGSSITYRLPFTSANRPGNRSASTAW